MIPHRAIVINHRTISLDSNCSMRRKPKNTGGSAAYRVEKMQIASMLRKTLSAISAGMPVSPSVCSAKNTPTTRNNSFSGSSMASRSRSSNSVSVRAVMRSKRFSTNRVNSPRNIVKNINTPTASIRREMLIPSNPSTQTCDSIEKKLCIMSVITTNPPRRVLRESDAPVCLQSRQPTCQGRA